MISKCKQRSQQVSKKSLETKICRNPKIRNEVELEMLPQVPPGADQDQERTRGDQRQPPLCGQWGFHKMILSKSFPGSSHARHLYMAFSGIFSSGFYSVAATTTLQCTPSMLWVSTVDYRHQLGVTKDSLRASHLEALHLV